MHRPVTILSTVGCLSISVAAHGFVQGIVANDVYYPGYRPSYQFENPKPIVIGWSDPEDLSTGFVSPSNYSDPSIICHLGATPAQTSAQVEAGSVVELQWTPWPDSHHGPVIDYLAKCPGRCEDVDKTTLEFFKIGEVGLVQAGASPGQPGNWGSDQLIANNNSWTVTIPKEIQPGNYVLRHEIFALHESQKVNGTQNYPQCINLEISGSGHEQPAGTLGTQLYKEDDPGVLLNIYNTLSAYTIPGPPLYSSAVSMSQTLLSWTATATASYGSSTAWAVATSSTSAASSSATLSTSVTSSSTALPTLVTSAYAALSTSIAVYSTTLLTSATKSVSSAVSVQPSLTATSTTFRTVVAAATTSAHCTPAFTGQSTSPGAKPSRPLPQVWTLGDLLQWTDYLTKDVWQRKGPR